ncbi:CHAT domain-containing protein [Leptolyngbya ohadii]|uniref:CHAT domain-containing protein n=1 Tax=Leptolyngbya ohadii TaxID=1962290 RepID=UPI000B598B35|nr:CHAT domain-containing protein [Leptolyngbya ohadii]
MGVSLLRSGYPQRAIEFHQQALKIARAVGDRHAEGVILGNIGDAYQIQNQHSQAISALEQSLAISQELDQRSNQAASLNNLGVISLEQKQYQEATNLFLEALAISEVIFARELQGKILSNLGRLYEEQEKYELAIVFLKQSVNVREGIRAGIRELDRSLQESYTETVAGTYRRLAGLLLEQSRLLEAEQVLELLKIGEIREFIRGTVENAETRKVQLSPAEQTVLDRHQSIINFAGTIAQCQQDASCRESDRMTTLNAQRRALTQEFDAAVQQFKAEVEKERAEDDSLVDLDELTNAGRAVVQTPGTVLIYPVVLDEKLWILWVTQGSVMNAIEVNIPRQDIDAKVLEFRTLMRGCESVSCQSIEDIEDIQAVSRWLYDRLFPDLLEEELEKNEIKNVVFALDRWLRYIPMAALFDGQQYLIEKYTVSTITAASLNPDSAPSLNSDDTSVLALGLSEAVPADPGQGIPRFSELPNVPIELSEIVREEGTRDSRGIYRGTEHLNQYFDENALLQAPGHQILHLATHGFFNPISWDASFLILGTKAPWRISNIQLDRGLFSDLKLVVLSACETALGGRENNALRNDEQDGREISSIAQSFITAGVDAVVASLWQVSDPATLALMEQFYRTLAQGTPENRISIAQALQTAQLQLLRGNSQGNDRTSRGNATIFPQPIATNQSPATTRYSHPYYWSAFVIIGNGL